MATFTNHLEPDFVYGGHDYGAYFALHWDKAAHEVHLVAFHEGGRGIMHGPDTPLNLLQLVDERFGRKGSMTSFDAVELEGITASLTKAVSGLKAGWSQNGPVLDDLRAAFGYVAVAKQGYDDWLRENDHENWLDQHRDDDPDQLADLNLTDEEAAALGVSDAAPRV